MTLPVPEPAETSALVFPGLTGTTFAALGRFLVHDRHARPLVRLADDVLGYSLTARLHASADDDYSEAAQVAALVSALALAERAEAALGGPPALCAGPSFGLRPTVVHTGSLDAATGILLTARIARREREYFRTAHTDVVTHTVVRVPPDGLADLVAGWTERGDRLEISGDLDSGFAMVTLREHLLDPFRRAISDLGGYNTHTMRTPAHSTLFRGLRAAMERDVFAGVTFAAPRTTVIADGDGSVVGTADGMRRMLLDTFDRPFDWRAVVAALSGRGVRTICFAGADQLFSRLDSTVRAFRVVKIDPRAAARPAPPQPLVRAGA